MLRKHNYRETGTTIGFRSMLMHEFACLRKFAAVCIGGTVLSLAPQAFGIAYVTNDVYTVTSYSSSSDRQQLNMYGGEIAFNNTGSYGFVRNVIRIDSPTDVSFVTTNAATPRPINFAKDVFNPGGGQLVLSESARFGLFRPGYNDSITWGRDMVYGDAVNRQPGGTGYPYLSPDVIKFTNPGDVLTITGRVALTAWPTCRYVVEQHAAPALYGDNMISGDMIQDGVFTLPWDYFFWANPLSLPSTAKLVIPSGAQVVVIHTELDTATGNLSYPGKGYNNYSNDINVAGELLVKAYYETTFYGDITGPNAGRINVQGSSANDNIKRFSGDLSGFNGWIRLYSSDGGTDTKVNMDRKTSKCYLDKSAPAGGIRIFAASNTTTQCAFYPEATAARAGDWYVGRLQAEGVYETSTYGLRGANWYLLSNQNLTIGSLESVGMSITGPTATKNSSTLTIGSLVANFELVIQNGLPVTIGSMGSGVKIRYYGTQVNTNAVNLAAGCVLGELQVPEGNTVYLNGGAVENVTGNGNLVVTGGDVRLGAVAATVNVQVQGGTVTFGTGVSLDDVVNSSNLGFWADPSDYSTLVGAYEGHEFWGERGQGEGTSSILGHTAYVYTNGFPLIERWYDKRSTQRVNFFWQDRYVDDSDAFFVCVYPYLMTGQLNGRSVMSFGVHGNTLEAKWSKTLSYGTSTEARRIPLMRGHANGGALKVQTAVMVFGSQNGGGRALLGGYDGNGKWTSGVTYGTGVSTNPACGGNYPRGGSGYGLENAIFSTYRDTWVDGVQINPTNTAPNGGWQIISFNGNGSFFRSLGMNGGYSTSGGQNYGEFLIFTNSALTAAQRQTVENYLAMKWGLSNALPAKGPVSVAAGATVKGAVAGVTGDGTWELNLPETTLSMDGSFTGALAGGGVITVADAADMPSLDAAFDGTVNVTGGNLAFTYANGAFTPAIVAPDADLAFPSAPTVAIAAPDGIEPGDYTLVSGKTLAGLDGCTLASDTIGKRRLTLERQASSLVLHVMPSGMVFIVK